MKTTFALLAISLVLTAPAAGQSDTNLANWTHNSIRYTATLKAGSLTIHEYNVALSSWSETGFALSDVTCAYLAAKPVGDPNPTEILLNFLTGPDIFHDGPKRVWTRNQNYPTPAYDESSLQVYFDFADKDTAVATANKIQDASGGHIQECK